MFMCLQSHSSSFISKEHHLSVFGPMCTNTPILLVLLAFFLSIFFFKGIMALVHYCGTIIMVQGSPSLQMKPKKEK